MKKMEEIVSKYLKDNKYDGLICYPDAPECQCEFKDNDLLNCTDGYYGEYGSPEGCRPFRYGQKPADITVAQIIENERRDNGKNDKTAVTIFRRDSNNLNLKKETEQ